VVAETACSTTPLAAPPSATVISDVVAPPSPSEARKATTLPACPAPVYDLTSDGALSVCRTPTRDASQPKP